MSQKLVGEFSFSIYGIGNLDSNMGCDIFKITQIIK